MGIVFTIPNTDFSASGVPLDQILPIDNNPVLVLDASGYNEGTGVWVDSHTGLQATVPAGAVKPVLSEIKGSLVPLFDNSFATSLKVSLSKENVDSFSVNYVAYNRTVLASIRYVFDLIKDSTRFLGTMAYSSGMVTTGPKIFSTSNSWQELGIDGLAANQRIIITVSVDRTSNVCTVYADGQEVLTISGFVVKPLDGYLYLGSSNSLTTSQVMNGYLANFSIYEGFFTASEALSYFNVMNDIYPA